MSEAKVDTGVLELLASRICHDLISPVGAVNNGVEFLEEMGADSLDESLELISYSAEQASAKLQAFRLAYGAGGKDPNIKPEDVQKAFSNFIRAEGKVKQSWDPFGPLGPKKSLPVGFCKMLMATLMLAYECLPKGGMTSVEAGETGETKIIAEGNGALLREHMEEALNGLLSPESLDPRLVHPYAIGFIGKSYGFELKVSECAEGRVVFSLLSPDSE